MGLCTRSLRILAASGKCSLCKAAPRSAYLTVLPQLHGHFQAVLRLMHAVHSYTHSQSVLCHCQCTLCCLATSASRGVITGSDVCAWSVLSSKLTCWVAARQSIMSTQKLHTGRTCRGGALSLKEVKLQPSSLPSPNASLTYATPMHRKDHSIIYILDNCTNGTDACSPKVTWPDHFCESRLAGVQQGDAQYGPDTCPTQHQCRKLEPAQER